MQQEIEVKNGPGDVVVAQVAASIQPSAIVTPARCICCGGPAHETQAH